MSQAETRVDATPRRFAVVASLAAVVLTLALAVGATASSGSMSTRLFAYAVPANTGPLHDGDAVWNYLYVANLNQLPNISGRSRMTLPDAYVVENVNQRVFVDGSLTSDFTFNPPPDVNPGFQGFSGRWPTTVTCAPGTLPPCTVIGKPAVIPGENTVVLFPGWVHGADEPNGSYVFRYTIHGTLNGVPTDLTASTQPIQMID